MKKTKHHIPKLLTFLTGISISCASFIANADPVSTPNAAPVAANTTAATSTTAAQPAINIPPAPDIDAAGYILMDANSGKVLASKNADMRRAPASLTKIMTMYLTAEALANGRIKLDDKVLVSKKAWSTGGSRMFLQLGQEVPVSEIIQGITIDSGNDATVAMAEHIGGSEDTFSSMMNETAQRLGMTNTHYTDSNGLPHPEHYSTPMDLAILARHLITDYPQYYEGTDWFSKKEFTYNGIRQFNRNRLLWRYPGADGLKTGHTDEAGYCLVASAKKDGMRLISVVMGAPSDSARADDTQSLLTYGFRFFKTYKVYAANQAIATPRVWKGVNKTTPAGVLKDLYITVPDGEYKSLQATTTMNKVVEAPVKKGAQLGELVIRYRDTIVTQAPIVALVDNPEGGIMTRLTDAISRSYHSWFHSDKSQG